jgi:hypothetical protein
MEEIYKRDIKEIFERMDLQHICDFLLNGENLTDIDKRSYSQRLYEDNSRVLRRLENIYKDNMSELTKADDEFVNAIKSNIEVYTEIGVIAGARLMFQLLCRG